MKAKLTYLFEAEFLHGRTYKQNKADASVKTPPILDQNGELQGKSCFADIEDDVRGYNIKTFSLIKKRFLRSSYVVSVNLQTGLFTINGLPILVESEKLPSMPERFKLIYYRQVTADRNVTFKKSNGQITNTQNMPLFIEYFIGWECEINGKHYEQKIAVA